jgi:methionyl-tRNA formyltransferase
MKIIFAGTPENAALALELVSKTHEVVLVITRPDAEFGRKRILTPSPVAIKAMDLGLPVL